MSSCLWFSPDYLVSSTNETDHHDVTEILLKVALSTITLTFKTAVILCILVGTNYTNKFKYVLYVALNIYNIFEIK